MPDGRYRIGALPVDVVEGVAKLADTDTIAGSTATMDRLFRFAVANSGLDEDTALVAAARQTSVNAGRALGLGDVGLTPGAAADLVVLDPSLTVTAVMRRGSWVIAPSG